MYHLSTVRRRAAAGAPGLVALTVFLAAGHAARADEILFWNQEVQSLEAASPAGNPMLTGRDLAMLNIAMYDGVNAALGSPDPSFYPTGPVITGSSPQAAVDAAALGILLQRFPSQAAQINAAYASQIATLPSNAATANGITLGQTQATTVEAARTGDGSTAPSTYVPGTGPGAWQPTPPAHILFGTANWATVTPFTMSSPSAFRPPPPPSLTSPAYLSALSEVQSIGSATSTTRTPAETIAAEFWASDGAGGVPLAWNSIALQVASTRSDSLLQNAQIFALLGASQTDSFIASFDSKAYYGLWRPVTAIQATTDPTWVPLIAAPPFPTYMANHASVAETGATILDALFGTDNADFSLTYDTDNAALGGPGIPTYGDVTESFTSFQEAATQVGDARIWAGVHFPFDIEQGDLVGAEVADNALAEFVGVPEPPTMPLLLAGICVLGIARRGITRLVATRETHDT